METHFETVLTATGMMNTTATAKSARTSALAKISFSGKCSAIVSDYLEKIPLRDIACLYCKTEYEQYNYLPLLYS